MSKCETVDKLAKRATMVVQHGFPVFKNVSTRFVIFQLFPWYQNAKLSTNWQNGPRWFSTVLNWFKNVSARFATFQLSPSCQSAKLSTNWQNRTRWFSTVLRWFSTVCGGSARFAGGSARFAVVQHGLRWFSTVFRWFSTVCRGSAWFGWWSVGAIAPNQNFRYRLFDTSSNRMSLARHNRSKPGSNIKAIRPEVVGPAKWPYNWSGGLTFWPTGTARRAPSI